MDARRVARSIFEECETASHRTEDWGEGPFFVLLGFMNRTALHGFVTDVVREILACLAVFIESLWREATLYRWMYFLNNHSVFYPTRERHISDIRHKYYKRALRVCAANSLTDRGAELEVLQRLGDELRLGDRPAAEEFGEN